MTQRQRLTGLMAGGLCVALLAAGDADAALYTGNVQTSSSGPLGGTTDTPASYQLASGDRTAVSTTSNAEGGSGFVRVTTLSQVAGASMLIDYTIRLLGPDSGGVPVNILASGYADGAGYYNASSGITVLQGTEIVVALGVGSPRTTPIYSGGRFDFTLDETILLEPNADYRVILSANASSGSGGVAFTSFAEAFVDPVFTIDPSFAGLYVLTGVPAVPEPAAWALMLAGASVLGIAMRRQRGGATGGDSLRAG